MSDANLRIGFWKVREEVQDGCGCGRSHSGVGETVFSPVSRARAAAGHSNKPFTLKKTAKTTEEDQVRINETGSSRFECLGAEETQGAFKWSEQPGGRARDAREEVAIHLDWASTGPGSLYKDL